jgi:hypothetical protein
MCLEIPRQTTEVWRDGGAPMAPDARVPRARSGAALTTGITAETLDGGLAEDLAAASLAMARRFTRGATLWCVAPGWEPHAHHMAVEFVHPVIAGKRALPAFALTGSDLVPRARVAVRSGDILIAVAAATDEVVGDLMRRAPAWGAASAWIGSGPRPAAGAADHVLWLAGQDPMAPATGGLVFLYHLLWELTQACFEHPGLLEPEPEGADDVCVTCADEGRLAEVVGPAPDDLEPAGLRDSGLGRAGLGRRALVRTAAGQETIDVSLVAPVSVGDLVLVHAGAGLTRAGGG